MIDVVGEKTSREGREKQPVVDVDVHEMLTSIKDLATGGDPCVPGRPDLKLKTYLVEVEGGEVIVYL